MIYIKTEDFPNALKNYLSIADISQVELAEKLGVPKQTVNNWIKGRSMPNHKRLEKLLEMIENEGNN